METKMGLFHISSYHCNERIHSLPTSICKLRHNWLARCLINYRLFLYTRYLFFVFSLRIITQLMFLIDKWRKIACSYLKFWFAIDLIAVIPITVILNSSSNVNDLSRVARLSRLYKLLKMIKLLRMMRIVKNRDKF